MFELYRVTIDGPAFPYDIVNNDNAITPADAVYVLNRVGAATNTGCSNAIADVDNNGVINQTDVGLVVAAIGQTLD